MIKSELRKIFLEKQKSLSQTTRTQMSESVVNQLFTNFDFNEKRFVNCFVTLEKNNELETSAIFNKIWHDFPHITMTAPRINFDSSILECVKVEDESQLVANKWEILEPNGERIVEYQKLDVVIVPLMAFDNRGFRVGYGKGFYDKFLNKCRKDCAKIGLSLFPPVEKIRDVRYFDVKLDFCITPSKIFAF
ncbi:MAG: 5-formyltetrahydrofolate cyclo-ligase [Pyrinomonadaceae bacterium]|nr:5-formyltetrahydrofolate cyclo-ligase [Pyrinomonadaceae bacterium]